MGTRTIHTNPVLTSIRIDPADPPRMWVEGQIQDDAGNVIQTVVEDIFPALTANQKGAVTTLVSRVQSRMTEIADLP